MPLTTDERATLLEPCACGHSFEDHGSACWECTTCNRTFEELLCERVAVIVAGRVVGGLGRVRGLVIDLDAGDPYTEGVRDSLTALTAHLTGSDTVSVPEAD